MDVGKEDFEGRPGFRGKLAAYAADGNLPVGEPAPGSREPTSRGGGRREGVDAWNERYCDKLVRVNLVETHD